MDASEWKAGDVLQLKPGAQGWSRKAYTKTLTLLSISPDGAKGRWSDLQEQPIWPTWMRDFEFVRRPTSESEPVQPAPVIEEKPSVETLEQRNDRILNGIANCMATIGGNILSLAAVSKADAITCIDEQIEQLQRIKKELTPKGKAWTPKPEGVVVGRW